MSTSAKRRGFTTSILHSDRDAPIEHGALHKPLHLSVAYGYRDARDLAAVFQGRAQGYAYGRQGNPTTAALEAKITAMEQGVATVCFATGMAAIGAIMLALTRGGDHVVASRYLFGNTVSLLNTLAAHGTGVTFVDATDAAAVEAALTPQTRLVLVETIANPRTQVADLARIGALCTARGLIYIVDNTMTSPWLFQPRSVGASLIVNALTKYIGGHGNALGGAITDTGLHDWSNDPGIADTYKSANPRCGASRNCARRGCATSARRSPPSRRITCRSARRRSRCGWTVRARTRRRLPSISRHMTNVRAVHYPGLASHPQHARALELFRAPGALLSFELEPTVDCFDMLNRLSIVVSSSNLGDNRTLAIPVAHTIFWEMGAERRAAMGIADSLIRVSVGIEDADDLIDDFGRALR